MEVKGSMQTPSPDPLGMSSENISTISPIKPLRPKITPRKALSNTSGNARVQDFYINTPPSRKSSPVKKSCQDDDGESPWRIRLTVQAERMDEHHLAVGREGDNILRVTEHTTTTTVPLKDGDDSPSAVPKRGRGRPRKSLDSPIKKNGTPKPKAVRRRKTMPDSAEADKHGKVPGTSPSAKKTGRRATNGTQAALEAERTETANTSVAISKLRDYSRVRDKSSRSRSRARRKEITPMKKGRDLRIYDEQSVDQTSSVVSNRIHSEDELQSENVVESTAPAPANHNSIPDLAENDMVNDPMTSTLERSTLDVEDEVMWRNMLRHGARSPSPNVVKKNVDRQVDSDKTADPTDEHQEFDSILESEGFSMVSVSSLASAERQSASPVDQDGSFHANDTASRERTPITVSPSPPRAPVREQAKAMPRQIDERTDGTPKLTRVVRTGAALQDALSPAEHGNLSKTSTGQSQQLSPSLTTETSRSVFDEPDSAQRSSPIEQTEGLFSGFGAGTRRELKAGLRLGEELAKRQRKISPASAPFNAANQMSIGIDNGPLQSQKSLEATQTSGSLEPEKLKYPSLSNYQLPSPNRSLADENVDCMSWRASTPPGLKEVLPDLQNVVDSSMHASNTSIIEPTIIARKAKWQQEREAVSRKIQDASLSNVIIIGSDDESSDQPSAKEYESSEDAVHSTGHLQADPIGSTFENNQPEVAKPRRSKIPSPWRRKQELPFSEELEPLGSNLFWQPDEATTEAAKKRQKRKEKLKADSTNDSMDKTDSEVYGKIGNSEDISKDPLAFSINKAKLVNHKAKSFLPTPSESESESEQIEEPSFTDATDELVQPTEELVIEGKDNSSFTRDNIQPTDELIVENSTTEAVADETSISFLLASSSQEAPPIDPLLLQQDKEPAQAAPQQSQPPPQPKSWLSALTAPINWLFVSKPSLPPATKSDILCSSPHRPLPLNGPWQTCHFLTLAPLYYASLLYGSFIFPYNPSSRSAQYCGHTATTPLGWQRKVSKADCGVTDAFMIVLKARGFKSSNSQGERIDEHLVVRMCVWLWADLCMTGEIKANTWGGEVIGMRQEGDRRWTERDIEWGRNMGEYFERKKREFGSKGLPSWREKGLI